MNDIKQLLLLPHIKVHNANALSSPFTIGFPAMTAWLGAVHALQRKLNIQGYNDIKFNGVAVISHECDLQTHKGVDDLVYSIIGTANPLDKTGSRSAFIEEARCHLDVSLVIEYTGLEKDNEHILKEKITQILNSKMKIASGDILTFKEPSFFKIEDGNDKDLHMLTRKLMPGYAIIERRDLMIDAMAAGQDAMDALLDNLAIHYQCKKELDGDEEKITWTSSRKNKKGWIVPIASGFHGLTDLTQAKNQRDPTTLHRFAESIVTLGEFKMPYHIKSITDLLWRYQTDLDKNLYLCVQQQQQTRNQTDDLLSSLFE